MATDPLGNLIDCLRRSIGAGEKSDRTDGQLLEDYIRRRDEAAVADLVRRHGPMVWGVCRRLLRNHHDAEDAFQATFLVLVRKAESIKPREMVGNWLYGVAHQTALKARATEAKRQARERQVKEMPEPAAPLELDHWSNLEVLLDQELCRLPDKYRVAIVLCDLEGKTYKVAACQLEIPEGTLSTRLRTARTMLAKRLARHRLAVSSGALSALVSEQAASACVPASVMSSTIKVATLVAAGHAAARGAISVQVAELTEGVLKTMLLTKLKTTMAWLLLAAALVSGVGVIYQTQAAEEQPLLAKPFQEKNVEQKPSDMRLAFDEKLAREKKFVIVGQVMSADGKTPLEGVEVSASAGYGTLRPTGGTKTDRDGRFRLLFGPGIHGAGRAVVGQVAVVHARKSGWHAWTYGWRGQFYLSDKLPAKADVPAGYTALVPGQPAPLEFRMQPAAALKVKLLDGAGKPLTGMRIWLTGKDLPPGASVITSGSTDEAGGFAATDVPRSPYRLVIEDPATGRGELELGSIHFRDAAEYEVLATVRKWELQSTDVSFRVSRGRDR